mgnify:CR=1 FL=1
MATIKNGKLVITIENCDGELLNRIQKSLILAIEEIGCCERSGYEDHQNAVFHLSDLLRGTLFTDSQANVALGGKPYKSDLKELNGVN